MAKSLEYLGLPTVLATPGLSSGGAHPSPRWHPIAAPREHHALVSRELVVLAVIVWATLLGFSALFVRMARSDSRRRR